MPKPDALRRSIRSTTYTEIKTVRVLGGVVCLCVHLSVSLNYHSPA